MGQGINKLHLKIPDKKSAGEHATELMARFTIKLDAKED